MGLSVVLFRAAGPFKLERVLYVSLKRKIPRLNGLPDKINPRLSNTVYCSKPNRSEGTYICFYIQHRTGRAGVSYLIVRPIDRIQWANLAITVFNTTTSKGVWFSLSVETYT